MRWFKLIAVILTGIYLIIPSDVIAGRPVRLIPKAKGSTELMRILKTGDRKSSEGLCVAPVKDNASKILSDAGIKTYNARPAEIKALATGIKQIQTLAGGKGFAPLKGAKFKFSNSRFRRSQGAYGGFDGTFVNIRRDYNKSDENVAHLMHELGHHVGNRDGIYGKYRSYVKSPCQFTHRCRAVLGIGSPRNEEFAEVFAAYILHPELLMKSGPNCQKAYDFFTEKIFAKGSKYAKCGATKGNANDDEGDDDDNSLSPHTGGRLAGKRMTPLPPKRPAELTPAPLPPKRPKEFAAFEEGEELSPHRERTRSSESRSQRRSTVN